MENNKKYYKLLRAQSWIYTDDVKRSERDQGNLKLQVNLPKY